MILANKPSKLAAKAVHFFSFPGRVPYSLKNYSYSTSTATSKTTHGTRVANSRNHTDKQPKLSKVKLSKNTLPKAPDGLYKAISTSYQM